MDELFKIIIGVFAAVILYGVFWEGLKKEKKKNPEYEPEDPRAPNPTGEEFDRKIEEVYGEDTLDNLFWRTWRYFDSHNSDKTVSLGVRDYQFDLICLRDGIIPEMYLEKRTFIETLAESGFERVDYVSKPMQFAVRGDIVDVFAKEGDMPYSIVFVDILEGSMVRSIEQFDIKNQRPACDLTRANLPIGKAILVTYWNVAGEDKHLELLALSELASDTSYDSKYSFIGKNAQKECQEYIMNVFGIKGEEKAYYTIPVTDSERESF